MYPDKVLFQLNETGIFPVCLWLSLFPGYSAARPTTCFNSRRKKMDERYLMHRLRSTSIAGIVGAVAIGSWILYQFYVKDIFRWDLFVILMIIGLVKIGAMIYYRRTD